MASAWMWVGHPKVMVKYTPAMSAAVLQGVGRLQFCIAMFSSMAAVWLPVLA